MRRLHAALAALGVLLAPSAVHAIPRFAARTGMECIQCHVNPSGSGVRNAYGRNVFEQTMLPLSLGVPPTSDVALDLDEAAVDRLAAGVVEGTGAGEPSFTGDLTDWLSVGGDVRAAYMHIEPDRGATAMAAPDVTSTFFLMEAYLYVHGRLHPNLDVVMQLGPYAGFEAWAQYRLRPEESSWNLIFKAGRFMPAFGLRDVEHQLYTREQIGFGNADRDTGLEITAYAGPFTAQVGIFNGTLGETPLDTHGTERRTFEKAVSARLSLRHDFGWARAQIGASFYFNEDASAPAPMFSQVIPRTLSSETAPGTNELRAGGFVTANVGRLTYLGELVFVRDYFFSQDLPTYTGYASYQELSLLVVQGLDVIAMLEFMDPNVRIADNQFVRAGLAVELYPLPFLELRVMGRRTWTDVPATGGNWDFVAFAHVFM